MTELPRGTVTFLFTDIEGSTALLKQLGEGYSGVLAISGAFSGRRQRRTTAARSTPREIPFFFAFARANAALAAAVEAQRELVAHRGPKTAQVRVRMGLHSGEPVVGDESYVGLGVHQAARIGAAGHGGQVLLSERDSRAGQERAPERCSAPRPREPAAEGHRSARTALPACGRGPAQRVPEAEDGRASSRLQAASPAGSRGSSGGRRRRRNRRRRGGAEPEPRKCDSRPLIGSARLACHRQLEDERHRGTGADSRRSLARRRDSKVRLGRQRPRPDRIVRLDPEAGRDTRCRTQRDSQRALSGRRLGLGARRQPPRTREGRPHVRCDH